MTKRIYTQHGMTGTKLHEVWKEMNRRCKNNNYKTRIYKIKNIQVSDEWKNAKNFIEWSINNGYKEGLEIDRIDNNGNYCRENCRWVTPKENANNRDNTIFIEYKGINKPLQYWAIEINVNPHTLHTRLIRGWSIEKALTTKTNKKNGTNKKNK